MKNSKNVWYFYFVQRHNHILPISRVCMNFAIQLGPWIVNICEFPIIVPWSVFNTPRQESDYITVVIDFVNSYQYLQKYGTLISYIFSHCNWMAWVCILLMKRMPHLWELGSVIIFSIHSSACNSLVEQDYLGILFIVLLYPVPKHFYVMKNHIHLVNKYFLKTAFLLAPLN